MDNIFPTLDECHQVYIEVLRPKWLDACFGCKHFSEADCWGGDVTLLPVMLSSDDDFLDAWEEWHFWDVQTYYATGCYEK